jgi:hypothetical protein
VLAGNEEERETDRQEEGVGGEREDRELFLEVQ